MREFYKKALKSRGSKEGDWEDTDVVNTEGKQSLDKRQSTVRERGGGGGFRAVTQQKY